MALEMNSFADTILRQRVVAQIAAAREGLELDPGANTCEQMEDILFSNAKSRDEYMQLIASLVLHLNEKKRAAQRCKMSQEADTQEVTAPNTEENETTEETEGAAGMSQVKS